MELKDRLLSVDIFRGLTICFMIMVNTPGSWEHVYAPMRHAPWHGFTPTDMVFPFFMTTVGISMALSMAGARTKSDGELMMKIVKRAALIFLVGLLLNYFPFTKAIADLRIWGDLQRIAASYLVAGLAVVLLKKEKNILIYTITSLLAYWALLYFGGDYTLEGNLNNKIDLWMLGENHLYKGYGIPFDPEGILGTITGGAHIAIGYLFSARYLKKPIDASNSIKGALTWGAILLVVAFLWNLVFPINKPIWTSSYVCLASGFALMIYALLFYLIDVKKWTKWAWPFKVFGLNPLASYALSGLLVKIFSRFFKIDGTSVPSYIYENIMTPAFGPLNGSLAYAIFYTFVIWLFAYLLYRNKIVVKL